MPGPSGAAPRCFGAILPGLAGIVERLEARIVAGEPIALSPLLARMAAAGDTFVCD